jgi:hypothetical protein
MLKSSTSLETGAVLRKNFGPKGNRPPVTFCNVQSRAFMSRSPVFRRLAHYLRHCRRDGPEFCVYWLSGY